MVEREDNLRVKERAISAATDVELPFCSFYAGGNISFLFDLSDFSQQACDKRPGNTGEEKAHIHFPVHPDRFCQCYWQRLIKPASDENQLFKLFMSRSKKLSS